eukprot:jgi/Ulvmu1/321/UM001_0325.1
MPGERAKSSQDRQCAKPATADADTALTDHEPTQKVLAKVAKLQADIDFLQSDQPYSSGHRLNRTSDADDVDPIQTPSAKIADTSSDDIQAIGNERAFQTEKVQLLDEMHRRQESYMRREDKLRARVEELEGQVDQLKTAQGVGCHDAKKEELRRDMEYGIRELLQKFSDHSTCMEQEELLQFRQQLQGVEEEIKKERAALSSQQQSQVESMLLLQQQLEITQTLALKLEAQNKNLAAEAQRVRADLKCQQAEQEEVLRQNIKVKRENESLRATVEALRSRFEALFAERDDLRSRLSAVAGGNTREQVMQAEHARAMEQMRRMVSAERSRKKAAQSAQLALQAQQAELQEVLRNLVDRVQLRHDAVDLEATTQVLPGCQPGSPGTQRRRSPLRTRSASRNRSPTPGRPSAEGSRGALVRMHSMSAVELSGTLPGPPPRTVVGEPLRRPMSAAERSMQSAPLPMAAESRLRRPVSAVERVNSCRTRGAADRRPSSAVELPRSTRVPGGVVSVGTAGAWRPRSAFVVRGATSRQPLGDMFDRSVGGSRLFPTRSSGLQKGHKEYPGRQSSGPLGGKHDDTVEESATKNGNKQQFVKKRDAVEQRRDKCQSGSKIETIVEEDLLDGDEENVVEEQLDVSWQPVV